MYGLLLPVPEHRKVFVTENSITQRYFVIEHFFSDLILDGQNMKDESILGSAVFEIKGKKKNDFSNSCEDLNSIEFESFRLLFDSLENLLK